MLVAVDEAHLIHEWLDGASLPVNIFVIIVMLLTDFRGPDFRKAFKRIGGLRALTKVPFMCLTATPLMSKFAIKILGLSDIVLNPIEIHVHTVEIQLTTLAIYSTVTCSPIVEWTIHRYPL